MKVNGPRLSITLIGFLIVGGCATPTAVNERSSDLDSSPSVLDQSLAGLVTLHSRDTEGERIGLGSGFAISGDYIVTNAHVVAGAASVEVYEPGGDLLGVATFATALDIELDLAVLRVPSIARRPLAIAAAQPRVGDSIWALGAPMGLEGTVSSGIIAATRNIGPNEFLQITAPISTGSSGGPVVDARGQVIGVVTGMLREGQNLNFAIPSSTLARLALNPASRVRFPETVNLSDPGDTEFADAARLALGFIAASELQIGDSINGRLETYHAPWKASVAVFYRINGLAGQAVQIDVMSDEIDMVADLFSDPFVDDAESEWEISDDDSGDGLNARIVTVLPVSTTYYLAVYSYDGATGPYTVSMTTSGRPKLFHAPDRRWEFVGEDSQDEIAYLIDSQTIRDDGAGFLRERRIWVLGLHASEQTQPDVGRFDNVLWDFAFRCSQREFQIRSLTYRRGDRRVHSDSQRSIWQAVPPGSVAEALMQRACEGQTRRLRTIDDL